MLLQCSMHLQPLCLLAPETLSVVSRPQLPTDPPDLPACSGNGLEAVPVLLDAAQHCRWKVCVSQADWLQRPCTFVDPDKLQLLQPCRQTLPFAAVEYASKSMRRQLGRDSMREAPDGHAAGAGSKVAMISLSKLSSGVNSSDSGNVMASPCAVISGLQAFKHDRWCHNTVLLSRTLRSLKQLEALRAPHAYDLCVGNPSPVSLEMLLAASFCMCTQA